MKAEYLCHLGDDNMIVDAARVSFDKHSRLYSDEQNAKLIRYLAREKHWTPFGHPQIQFRISAPIFVARQWFRSNVGVVRSETSRRYVDDTPVFFTPSKWRAKPESSIKQGSGKPLHRNTQDRASDYYIRAIEKCLVAYEELLRMGVAPEQARTALPQSTETQWIETGSLAYYARICKQRMDGHAQIEAQDLARMVADQIAPLFPVAWPELMQ